MANRTTFLLLSGGLDSTTCLFKLLTETDDDIFAFYVDVSGNSNKAWCEKNAINQIEEQAKKIRKFKYESKLVTYDIWRSAKRPMKSAQPLLWLMASGFVVGSEKNKLKRLCIGYTKGDNAADDITSIKDSWKMIWGFLGDEKRVPPLYTPLLKTEKHQSLKYLQSIEKQYNLAILPYIWTCEDPTFVHENMNSGYKACNECTPCIKWDSILR